MTLFLTSGSNDVRASVYMLATHVAGQSALGALKAGVTRDKGPWIQRRQPCCFSSRGDGPFSPIERRRSRVAPLLWRCKIHNGVAAQCGGTSFTPLLCHPFHGAGWGGGGVGSWGRGASIPREGPEKLCEKVQLQLLFALTLTGSLVFS